MINTLGICQILHWYLFYLRTQHLKKRQEFELELSHIYIYECVCVCVIDILELHYSCLTQWEYVGIFATCEKTTGILLEYFPIF